MAGNKNRKDQGLYGLREGFIGAAMVRALGLGTVAADKAHRLDFMTALQFIYVYLYKNLMSVHLCLTYF